jgi:hypothetical protein
VAVLVGIADLVVLAELGQREIGDGDIIGHAGPFRYCGKPLLRICCASWRSSILRSSLLMLVYVDVELDRVGSGDRRAGRADDVLGPLAALDGEFELPPCLAPSEGRGKTAAAGSWTRAAAAPPTR